AAVTTKLDLGGGRTAYAHRVTFTGLAPATSYWYRVGDGATWSEWLRFRTAAAGPEPFRFIYVGDAQNDIRSLWSRAVREAVMAAPDARFIVSAGDLVAEGWDDALWGEWSGAQGFLAAMIPSLPSPGNHDLHKAPGDPAAKTVATVNALWRSQFTLPHNGPSGVPELADEAWFIDVQGVRIVSLDANVYAEDNFDPEFKAKAAKAQLEWLGRVLSDNPSRWTIVVHHQPVYSVGKDRDNAELREALLPIYDRYHVDLVLQGHDHSYGRTRKLAGGRPVAADMPGTVYAVSVSGPKMYPLNHRFLDLMAVTKTNTQMYQVILVAGDRLSYEAHSITGELVDAFELRKDGTGVATLVEGRVGR
ncbi:MAG TPA: metallophosphoesterase family protein, partial [Thermoanaerobaculaceae bacterium]|nr:metallophosphoesterase family protein [Thermoanaerobaculaceae bacterium]